MRSSTLSLPLRLILPLHGVTRPVYHRRLWNSNRLPFRLQTTKMRPYCMNLMSESGPTRSVGNWSLQCSGVELRWAISTFSPVFASLLLCCLPTVSIHLVCHGYGAYRWSQRFSYCYQRRKRDASIIRALIVPAFGKRT